MVNIIKTNSVYILNLQAKDAYISNNLKSDMVKNKIKGYVTKIKGKQYNTKKYVNAIDYSLDLIKLRKIDKEIFNSNDFSFFNENGKEFSNKIININFNYSVKTYNKFGKTIYIKNGYIYKQIELNDCIYIEDNCLIGIEINKQVKNPISKNLLGKHFEYNKEKNIYELAIKNIKTEKSVKELREHLYENGFYCNGIKYIRFKRSSGSSRVGKCLFIDKRLYDKMHQWDLCGLNIKNNDKIDLAAFESYISLPSSSIIDTLQLNKKNILVVDDWNSIFQDNVIATKIIDGKLITQEETVEISNSIWDGQSLLDVSVFGKYENKGMLLLRERFFKTCGFNTNIQKFFKDNNITDISQLNGITLAQDIKDIKLITTPNSIKYLKFGKLENWLNIIDCNFGIVKYEKETPYFDGKLVQSHYQLLNTLQFTFEEMQQFMKPTIEYIRLLRDDPEVVRYHIKYPKNEIEIENIENRNDLIFKLMGINSNFYKTKFYDDFKRDLIKSFIKNVRSGHILIGGNYSTIFGNPMEMLKHSIGTFNGTSEIISKSIYCKKFKDEEKILGSRSPHICSSNILLTTNKYVDNIDKYFNLTNEIVCINSIGDNILEKLNGADFDSDTLLLSNDKLLINIAERNYNKFKVPTSLVEAKKIDRYYNWKQQADLDIKTSVNKIGEIINLSQELNSLMWDNLYKNKDYDYQEIYLDICKLAIMSCIEIDKAKKEFDVDNVKEMDLIRKKYRKKFSIEKNDNILNYNSTRPKFLKMITKNNGYIPSKNIFYKDYYTPMDYLQKILNKECFIFYKDYKNQEFLKIEEIINMNGFSFDEENRTQKNRILNLINQCKEKINNIWKDDDFNFEQKKHMSDSIKINIINRIKKMQLNHSTKISLLKNSFSNKLYFDVLLSMDYFWFYFRTDNFYNSKKLEEKIYNIFNINL